MANLFYCDCLLKKSHSISSLFKCLYITYVLLSGWETLGRRGMMLVSCKTLSGGGQGALAAGRPLFVGSFVSYQPSTFVFVVVLFNRHISLTTTRLKFLFLNYWMNCHDWFYRHSYPLQDQL